MFGKKRHKNQHYDMDLQCARNHTAFFVPRLGWKSKYISEHGPQGPVAPLDQKLSSDPIHFILSTGTPTLTLRS